MTYHFLLDSRHEFLQQRNINNIMTPQHTQLSTFNANNMEMKKTVLTLQKQQISNKWNSNQTATQTICKWNWIVFCLFGADWCNGFFIANQSTATDVICIVLRNSRHFFLVHQHIITYRIKKIIVKNVTLILSTVKH